MEQADCLVQVPALINGRCEMFVSIKKIIMAVAMVGLCSCFLLACSGNGKDANGGKAIKTQDDSQYLGKNNVHTLGEKVSLVSSTPQDPNTVKMECTVKAATLYDKPEAANIARTQVLTSEDCHLDLKTGMGTPLDFSKVHFLLCDITIKNIHIGSGDTNITDLSLVYLLPDTKKLVKVAALPAYFSKSQSDVNASDYFHYKLPVGQSMDAKIGWWVDLNECKKENLYVMYSYGGDKKYQQAWKLGL